MINRNHLFLNSFVDVPDKSFIELQKISAFREVGPRIQLVKLGEVPSKVYMLLSGMVRCYLSTESGKEFNKSFYQPSSFVASLTALLKDKPSLFCFETLTTCKLYEIDYRKLIALSDKDPKIKNLYARVLEFVYMKYEKRLVELISLTAKERYLELQKQIPDLDVIIPQYHIASYLGITPVQLSRIRKQISIFN